MAKRKRTVAYIEDEPAVQRLVAWWLEDAGYRVVLADDGAAGLELIRAERPDLVITDALMPRMTGDELIEVIVHDPDLSGTPIIMATAAASPLRVKKMLGLGCHAVLAKPLVEETLLAAVNGALTAK